MNSTLYQERGKGEPREASEPDRPGDQEDRRRGGVRRAGREAPGALPRFGLEWLPIKGESGHWQERPSLV
jgi:hypothetical protein